MSFSGAGNAGVVKVLIATYIGIIQGNPNGLLGGQAGSDIQVPDMVWDSVDDLFWTCTTTGTPTTAVWTQGLGVPGTSPFNNLALGRMTPGGLNQAGSAVITTQNVILTGGPGNRGVRLPTQPPIPGLPMSILNTSTTNTYQIYPNVGGTIFSGNGLTGTLNAPINVLPNTRTDIWFQASNVWLVPGQGIGVGSINNGTIFVNEGGSVIIGGGLTLSGTGASATLSATGTGAGVPFSYTIPLDTSLGTVVFEGNMPAPGHILHANWDTGAGGGTIDAIVEIGTVAVTGLDALVISGTGTGTATAANTISAAGTGRVVFSGSSGTLDSSGFLTITGTYN